MHESEKWKWSFSVVSNPQKAHGLQPSRLLRLWDFPGKNTWVRCHCLLRPSSIGLYQFTFPPTVQAHFLFSTPSPAFTVCRLFDDHHSDWCGVISHYSFDLHFSNNKWCWTSSHVFVSHLYVFLWRNVYLGLLAIFWLGYLVVWYCLLELFINFAD